MDMRCKNCTGQLVFDPKKQMLVCDNCGSVFSPAELGADQKDLLWDTKVESLSEIYGIDSPEFMDSYVYICKSCGGEIVINGTETSTRCVYCGNTAVVFSRMAKQKRPEYIVPFKLTEEDAVEAVRSKFAKGFFIPRSIKKFKPDEVRGIYIPYKIVNCSHKGSVVVSGKVKQGKNTVTKYYGRAGHMNIIGLPLDASRMLSDDSSSRLEPFDLDAMEKFEESYLLGFYSNISDVTYGNLKSAASRRADAYFNELVLKSVHDARSLSIQSSNQITTVNFANMKYAMFPAWFVTYTHNGIHNTVIVNGQTGKVVCGVPWNKAQFYSLMTAAGILFSALFFLVLKYLLPELVEFNSPKSSVAGIEILAVLVFGALSLFSYGIARIKKVTGSIGLTQAVSMFNFVSRRQGS